MHDQARVVIIGSGIAGSSIAYHLTERGWRDIGVLEQGPLFSGRTSHAPGLVGRLRSSISLTKMLVYSISLYKELQINGNLGYSEVGSLRLASSKERMEELKRQVGFSKSAGLEAQLISASEAKRMFPMMSLEGVEGALFLPTDGSAKAPILAEALARIAQERGATFYDNTRVTGIEVVNGHVQAINTSRGCIRTEIVVVAAGIWSPRIGRMVGISIPLIPMQHQYALTAPLPELSGQINIPNLRDPDNLVYFRQDGNSIVLGGYEHDPAFFDVDAIPDNSNPTVQSFDPPRFESLMQGCIKRVPSFRGVELVKQVNGLESFTPDGEFVLGESPDVQGFWAACGFCAHGISGAGGVGKMMAEWIIDGEPSLDLWKMDLRRFGDAYRKRDYTLVRTIEVYSTYYDIHYPNEERQAGRPLRVSPTYPRLTALGASFGEKSGWERPNWFDPNADGQHEGRPAGWAGHHWSPAIPAEHRA